ncbi:MAG: Stp1/IreP family PP2C-type Ser/Thr phosphatase [Clostridia bacterium]|nr:Stp1/IreP family PP2C-type Ser/Thr phosphatase [Clostridia bacterium]MBQ2092095.1 Stp1/IreP family PP2C-type Ser/Thr phosphatase [Clostridia bacterium]MBQ3897691.1 Stp1/IreP family PP2C-type Ser/Thr phosphatase [Clostridia bacterium]
MRISAKTDVGKVRPNNQDSYAAGEFQNGVTWVVVCDGMGGYRGGNIASSAAVKTISERITGSYRENMTSSSIKNLLVTSITNANFEIFDMAAANEELKGMGTTVVAALITKKAIYIAHAGDSRAYLAADGKLRQITKDHSVVQELVDSGEITREQAMDHPQKNLITRALGVEEIVKVDFTVEDIKGDETLLICTDGLTNEVTEDEILRVLSEKPFEEVADTLVDMANENGGNDNITAVAITR